MSPRQLHRHINQLGCSTGDGRFPMLPRRFFHHNDYHPHTASSARICRSPSPLRYELGVVLHIFLPVLEPTAVWAKGVLEHSVFYFTREEDLLR